MVHILATCDEPANRHVGYERQSRLSEVRHKIGCKPGLRVKSSRVDVSKLIFSVELHRWVEILCGYLSIRERISDKLAGIVRIRTRAIRVVNRDTEIIQVAAELGRGRNNI